MQHVNLQIHNSEKGNSNISVAKSGKKTICVTRCACNEYIVLLLRTCVTRCACNEYIVLILHTCVTRCACNEYIVLILHTCVTRCACNEYIVLLLHTSQPEFVLVIALVIHFYRITGIAAFVIREL